MKTEKKNLRRISIVVTAQTKGNLDGWRRSAGTRRSVEWLTNSPVKR